LRHESQESGQALDLEIERTVEAIRRSQADFVKLDGIQRDRMTDADGAIEMLKSGIESCNERVNEIIDGTGEIRKRMAELQRDLLKTEEKAEFLLGRLNDTEQQKAVIKMELDKLERNVWTNRRRTLLRSV
jgi:chromosome segregation ATPase